MECRLWYSRTIFTLVPVCGSYAEGAISSLVLLSLLPCDVGSRSIFECVRLVDWRLTSRVQWLLFLSMLSAVAAGAGTRAERKQTRSILDRYPYKEWMFPRPQGPLI